jgi:hypothetical protein
LQPLTIADCATQESKTEIYSIPFYRRDWNRVSRLDKFYVSMISMAYATSHGQPSLIAQVAHVAHATKCRWCVPICAERTCDTYNHKLEFFNTVFQQGTEDNRSGDGFYQHDAFTIVASCKSPAARSIHPLRKAYCQPELIGQTIRDILEMD